VSSWLDVSNIWQIFPALTLVASLIIYYKSRKTKKLSYKIITNEPLLTVDEELQGKVKVLYENNPLEDISLLIIKFLNNGNEPIKSDDFEEPVTMSFSPNVGVLSTELINANPSTIRARLNSEKDKIIIEPLLLNKGDSITIKMLLTGSKLDCHIPSHANIAAYGNSHPFHAETDLMLQSRIIGVTNINEITEYILIKLPKNHNIKLNKDKIKSMLAGILTGFVLAASSLMISVAIIKWINGA
jgi:hypothetical protein